MIVMQNSGRRLCSPGLIMAAPLNPSRTSSSNEDERIAGESAWKATQDILSPLPNDLTRLVYLASIRDYNSGAYRHPVLSRQFGSAIAHQTFQLSHQEVFSRLLMDPISKYVEQLDAYIRYSRAERGLFISTWNTLQAYKAT